MDLSRCLSGQISFKAYLCIEVYDSREPTTLPIAVGEFSLSGANLERESKQQVLHEMLSHGGKRKRGIVAEVSVSEEYCDRVGRSSGNNVWNQADNSK